jgi:hypothetical protein
LLVPPYPSRQLLLRQGLLKYSLAHIRLLMRVEWSGIAPADVELAKEALPTLSH